MLTFRLLAFSGFLILNAEILQRAGVIDYLQCHQFSNPNLGYVRCSGDGKVAVGLSVGNTFNELGVKCCSIRASFNGTSCHKKLSTYLNPLEEELSTGFVDEYTPAVSLWNEAFGIGFYSERTKLGYRYQLLGRILKCSDDYVLPSEFDTNSCVWSKPLNTLNGHVQCPDHMAITGIDCSGYNCHQKRIKCCPIKHACAPGYYGNNVHCKQCPRGRYGDSWGLTSAECSGVCPVGTFGMSAGAKACTGRCPKGTYSMNSTLVKDCTPCPKGTFGDKIGLMSSECSGSCPEGTYSNSEGITSNDECIPCPISTYSCTPKSTKCTPCRQGTFYNQIGGKSERQCIPCPKYYRSGGCSRHIKDEI